MVHGFMHHGAWTMDHGPLKLLEASGKPLPPPDKGRKNDFTKTPHSICFGKPCFRPLASCRPPICSEEPIPQGKECCVVPAEMARFNTVVYPMILRAGQHSSERPKTDPDVCVKKTAPLTYQCRCHYRVNWRNRNQPVHRQEYEECSKELFKPVMPIISGRI